MIKVLDTPSPNFNDRRHPLDLVVLHYTGMETGEAALARMRDPSSEVSAHYMVETDGRVFRLVEEDKRAWHAGVSTWQGDEDLNSRSIGIEIVNGGHDFPDPNGDLPPYPALQIESVIELLERIYARHPIRQSRIVGHSDIAPDRKQDPGEHFPWIQLADRGFGFWVDAASTSGLLGKGLERGETGEAVRRLQEHLFEIGYDLSASGTYDAATELTVRAFQRRWVQQKVDGQADIGTIVRIARIADYTRTERSG